MSLPLIILMVVQIVTLNRIEVSDRVNYISSYLTFVQNF